MEAFMLKKFTMLVSTIVFSASMVFGSGFSIYEQGAKATSMGGAFIAQANDVSGVFYNPAGITALDGFQLGLGTTIITTAFDFTGPVGIDPNLYTKAEEGLFPPTHLYATYKLNDQLSLGFGFFTMYGLGSEWPADWVGRELATTSEVQTFTLNPVVAYKLMDNLSVAVGLQYIIGNVVLEKSAAYIAGINDYVESKLDASGSGVGFNIGVQYKATDDLSIGVVYRSNVTLAFDGGDATFDFNSTTPANDAFVRGLFPNTKGSSELTLPTEIGVGVAYNFTKDLTAEFDWMQLGWSSYDELVVKFDDPIGPDQITETVAEKNYEDSYSLRFGLEYRMDKLALRLGYLRDNRAVPDEFVEPTLPEGDRNLYSIGAGYTMGDITIDAFYMLLTQDDRKITTSKVPITANSPSTFNGEYKGLSNLFGLTLGYSFK
jgi:long-chain fatty acid transport protein